MIIVMFIVAQNLWIETTQQDFVDGVYEKNIYASHRGSGALEFAPRFDLNNDGCIDLFTSDESGPYIKIYWGAEYGYTGLTTLFPTTGGANNDAADLNLDGYADFIAVHANNPKLTIYWGTPTGPNSSFYTEFLASTPYRQSVVTADFDKDGFLDIATSQEFIQGYGAILWGDSLGYDINDRTDLPLYRGLHNAETADLDLNGWLDLIFVDFLTHPGGWYNRIYWGDSSGFSPANYTLIQGPEGNFGVSLADLNYDHYLDMVCTGRYDVRSFIFWGSDSGYSENNKQILNPTACLGGSAVAHMNDDPYLDIVYHHGGYGGQQQRIYWGSDTGYSDSNVTYLGLNLESTGGFVADLDYDGQMDIFINALGSNSYVYWGPYFTAQTQLSSINSVGSMFREAGNVYDRSYEEPYLSSVFNADDIVNWGTIEWDDSLPSGTATDFMLRTGNTPIVDSTWSAWCALNNGDSIPDSLNAQYMQYMALLQYTNPAYLPCLYEVRISYENIPGIKTYDEPSSPTLVSVSPNPFTINTNISYTVSNSKTAVSIRIYDITGRIVKTLIDQIHEPGKYNIIWAAKDDKNQTLPEGIYYLTYGADNRSGDIITIKTIYIKE